MINIATAFPTNSETVFDFFQRREAGYYIPLYQRLYSWDNENVDQLMEDICNGVIALANEKDSDRTIHFLGTIILVVEKNARKNIDPQDPRALPDPIKNVIDGQQRISTMALLACCLYKKIYDLNNKLSDEGEFASLKNKVVPKTYLEKLENIFSLELGSGNPEKKPRIIRGSVDQWTLEGSDENYQSDVSSFLARFIRSIYKNQEDPLSPRIELPSSDKKSNVSRNVGRINSWLRKVEQAHSHNKTNNFDFPEASNVLEIVGEANIWSYERREITELLKPTEIKEGRGIGSLKSLVQLLGFTHYFLRRCCFTIIIPESENWAFDMFQSLNATGTPLTALETFKPEVVARIGSDSKFKDSLSAIYFSHIDDLLGAERTASSKSKLTNDFLTLFGTSLDGSKQPARQFSRQRRWLSEKYSNCRTIEDKEEFIHRMSDTALYWKNAINFNSNKLLAIEGLDSVDGKLRDQAALCIQYLQDANHKMAHTLLSRFYSKLLREPETATEFAKVCKKIAAFFTLWRSALPNTGLDDVYRSLLREKFSWEHGNTNLRVSVLNEYLHAELKDKEIADKAIWLSRAKESLKYNKKRKICKFALLLSSHETIPDPNIDGLMTIGKKGSTPDFLNVSSWESEDFKSIEHVAPQNQSPGWDDEFYTEKDDCHQIGNLVLFPVDINSSVGNKGWQEKYLYYKYLAEKNPSEREELMNLAEGNNIELTSKTLKILANAGFKNQIEPIVTMGISGEWNRNFVDKRSERICQIVWERMNDWLGED